ncbi:copper transporter 1-like [Musa acuminata AAA Group]|uniref:copper transporter 1-like n=1 Tax=Musa acuminata AAA Group TaxID=214697 RepID=UPI0031D69D8C
MARSYLGASAAQSPDRGVETDKESMCCAHPTFFPGCNSMEVVFPGMHALALAAVFSASVLVEWCDHRLVIAAAAASGLTQTAMHAARVGLGYVLMLAVMSDAAAMAAAVLGHALGFVAFVHAASRPLTPTRRLVSIPSAVDSFRC